MGLNIAGVLTTLIFFPTFLVCFFFFHFIFGSEFTGESRGWDPHGIWNLVLLFLMIPWPFGGETCFALLDGWDWTQGM
jgi:hypothetical protein